MSAVEVVLIAAAVIFVIGRRLIGEPLQAKRLLVMPVVLGAWGFTQLGYLDPAAVAVLVAEAIIALGLGAARGLTIAVYEQAGHLWYRYRPVTIAVWVATIGVRIAMVLGAGAIGVHLPTSGALLLTFAVSLAGEAAVVAARAQRLGVPFAPDRRTARLAAAHGRRNRYASDDRFPRAGRDDRLADAGRDDRLAGAGRDDRLADAGRDDR